MRPSVIVGIDEAGRGPLAGPVAVGACRILANDRRRFAALLRSPRRRRVGFKDSKQLSEKAREEWFARMKKWKKEGVIDYAVCFASARSIDKRGIVPSIRRALDRALAKLALDPRDTRVLLDGGLKASEIFQNQQTIIKGDEKEAAIALASIAAKVLRDRLMTRRARRFPLYSFEVHKGYGTLVHCRAIRRFGLSTEHRKSFCKSL